MLTDVDATNLLKHLVDITKNRPMEVPVVVELEAVREAATCNLQGCILDSLELGLDFRVVRR